MNKSETIGKLAEALCKAQASMGSAKKDADNLFFKSKYADLASVVEAIKKPLADNGLSYVQTTDIDESGSVVVETVLMHSSGEWLSGRLRMPVAKANDAQALGSALTYCRRYGLQAMAGIPADDDDGNAATGKSGKEPSTAAPDSQGKQGLEACTSLDALSDVWKTLTPAQRSTLGTVKDQMKTRLMQAEEATQA